jgi:hypothetical protein
VAPVELDRYGLGVLGLGVLDQPGLGVLGRRGRLALGVLGSLGLGVLDQPGLGVLGRPDRLGLLGRGVGKGGAGSRSFCRRPHCCSLWVAWS